MRDWTFEDIDFSTYPFYDGNDLGVTYAEDCTRIRVWAPTAKEVEFRIYKTSTGGEAIRIDHFVQSEFGTWTLNIKGNLKGYYYTIRVNDGEWLNETPGIDARALGINGQRGLIFDPELTNPVEWDNDQRIKINNPVDAIIYEVHVRDFSISPSSGIKNKGKFIAFAEEGTVSPQSLKTGIDHLKELGITHLHLLPVNDYRTVDEKLPDESYNWGYDPYNFNAPEGSYSTDPDNTSRITELKMLVQSLHKAGIGVILDVVYNHTYYTRRSWFNQTVPGYYYRQKHDGTFSNASGCGNEIATERAMVRKYICESLKYWAEEFHIDGFRFDLMGIYDLETMNQIRKHLDAIDSSIVLYGEGWAADVSPLDESQRATKNNVSQLDRIAVFNDDFRDGIKGNNYSSESLGFVSGQTIQEETIKFGITAACHHPQITYGYVHPSKHAYAKEPWQCVNYASCHDNHTLYDKFVLCCAKAGEEELIRMNMLAGALIFTSQGIPFLHAGAEMARTKNGDENSYRSSDAINQIDWERKFKYLKLFNYYKQLISLRKNHPAFRMTRSDQIRDHLIFSEEYLPGIASYVLVNHANGDEWRTILVVFNGNSCAFNFPVMEHINWRIIAKDEIINENSSTYTSGSFVEVTGRSMLILAED